MLLVLAFIHIATSLSFIFSVGNFCSSSVAVCFHTVLDVFVTSQF